MYKLPALFHQGICSYRATKCTLNILAQACQPKNTLLSWEEMVTLDYTMVTSAQFAAGHEI